MSEWTSFFVVFWALWAADGARVSRQAVFYLNGTGIRLRGALRYARFVWPGSSVLRWRVTMADVPLALSPIGLTNRPVGSAGRPAETPAVARAWRWADVREVGVAKGWVFVNGERCCPDTGHVAAPALLELARLPAAARERKIRTLVAQWLRPTHLRRRARVLADRTRASARLNLVVAFLLLALTIYVVADVPSRLAEPLAQQIARVLPGMLLAILALHVSAVVVAWRTLRRLKPVRPQKRTANLLSALLLPPQGLRLRGLLGEGFFPPQHPVALALAFGPRTARREFAFNALADLRWPIPRPEDPPLAGEIAAWFATALAARLEPVLATAGSHADNLLAPPVADTSASCAYCPRCGDQFAGGAGTCPHGIPLRPLRWNARHHAARK